MISRFVQFEGRVFFLGGSVWSNRGSKISHSASVRLLEYGMVARLDGFKHLKAEAQRCQMGSILSD
jgi:hypothetical protein